ncbi:patatin-like phospholipase family protein [Bradyrhizobium ontarionense]|uniref:Patatin-like phospholipase family protein n=1 Tax=Bradyrhizobium ontarionense TaxID=2898149 RepID=A0ABY3RFJ0_9BRAD|nr:patatin-like phospholipase family protein [Bradyrhizobium sp. A19]UFZ06220.1 patatin-like phospholipase family protein [Bradyrhizobium sp. A19]
MWLRKTNSSGSPATRDDRTHEEPAQQAAAPVRSSASALLSAAQIWSTDSSFGSTSPAAEPTPAALSEPVPCALEPALEVPSTESAPAEIAPAVADPIVADPIVVAIPAAAISEPKLSDTPERSLAETIATVTLPPPPRIWPPRKLSLALQGGGTFSAFTWGVLERLLEEPGCDFDTISGASAGAIHAALLASGLAEGGREAARALLARFWNGMIDEASFRSLMLLGSFSPASSAVSFGSALRSGRADPLDLDPLRDMLVGTINFDAVQSAAAPRLLIAATRVRDGQPQIFRNADITPDVLLASTCAPQLHGAVDIDGDAYWDGGYGANPPIISVAHESSAADLLVVKVTPARDDDIPVTAAAIDRRLDQITANAVLNAELAALEWARSDGLHPPRVHRLAAEDEIEALAQHSATDFGSGFIEMLHQRGRAAADRWLQDAPAGTTLAIPDKRPVFPSENALEIVPA